jgi:hypothetical protein
MRSIRSKCYADRCGAFYHDGVAFLRAVFVGLFWIGVWFAVSAAPARADGDATTRGPTGLVIGGKLGGGLGEPLNESSASFAAEVELGYVLPPLDHAFELFTAFASASIADMFSK